MSNLRWVTGKNAICLLVGERDGHSLPLRLDWRRITEVKIEVCSSGPRIAVITSLSVHRLRGSIAADHQPWLRRHTCACVTVRLFTPAGKHNRIKGIHKANATAENISLINNLLLLLQWCQITAAAAQKNVFQITTNCNTGFVLRWQLPALLLCAR